MHFDIDDQRYTVSISSRPLFHDGKVVQARLDSRGLIFISDQVPAPDRRRILFHELRHAWVFSRGLTNGEEADADDAGEMIDVVMRQYNEQGGDAVLEALQPDADKRIMRQSRGPGVALNVQCGHCEAHIAIGSVQSGPPEWSEDLGGWIMARGAWCELCDCVTTWTEGCTANGTPLASVMSNPPPKILRGAAAARWFAEHRDSRIFAG